MKFTASQADLSYGLQTVAKAVSTKNTLPILSGILVKGDGNRLNLTATDLEIGIECMVSAQVAEEGSIVLPARYLTEIVRKIPAAAVEVEVDPRNYTAVLRWDRSQYTIHGFSPEQFPFLPRATQDAGYKLPQNVLRNMIRQTAFAVSHDETRPILTGAQMTLRDGHCQLLATDGVRIAYRRTALPESSQGGQSSSLVLPGRTLSELSRLLAANDEDTVGISVTPTQAFFDLGDVRLVSRLLEGQYPDVLRLVPQSYSTSLTLSAQQLHDACERASLIARDGSGAIKLGIDPERVTITSSTPEVGQVYEEVAASVQGDPLEIGLNPRFVMDGLKALDSDQLLFEFSGNRTPSRMKPQDRDDFLYVVLPIVVW